MITCAVVPDSLVAGAQAARVRRIASVVLNFNSDADVHVLMPQLLAQRDIHHAIILVDNASAPECVERLQRSIRSNAPELVAGGPEDVQSWIRAHPEEAQRAGRVFLVLNHENRGYSAGNNVGAILADLLGAAAALIANPDMRLENPFYIARLADALFASDTNCIAGSRIIGIDGENQSPLREPRFWEEFFWLRHYLPRFGSPKSYVLEIEGADPVAVPKLPGCCLLARMEFLRATGFLDESVFMYCEEAILSAKACARQGHLVYVPAVLAIHAHEKAKKANSSERMLQYIESRRYYLRNYTGYGRFSRWLLNQSYSLMALAHRVRLSSRHKPTLRT
jgi:GT2 family glycosyltransferase